MVPPVFKTGERCTAALAGSIPVRLRHLRRHRAAPGWWLLTAPPGRPTRSRLRETRLPRGWRGPLGRCPTASFRLDRFRLRRIFLSGASYCHVRSRWPGLARSCVRRVWPHIQPSRCDIVTAGRVALRPVAILRGLVRSRRRADAACYGTSFRRGRPGGRTRRRREKVAGSRARSG